MTIQTPEWVKNAVFYQIFPDRFSRSSRINHPRGISLKPWGNPPKEQGFQGGDLYGVVERLDYLQDLGITAIYFNPVFSSASNHRYHTFDYFEVDPLLGGNEALRELLDAAHDRGIRVVLDGVFNHASRGFWPFHHILENGKNSPYLDWFHINGWPLRPYHGDKENPANYEAWWGLPALPKLNINNPGVREYIFNVARHWVEFGIDGWRLDVPEEIDDDSFWQEFRHVVKYANPEAYICGEIWHSAQRWCQGDQFDAVMNYLFASTTMCFFGRETLQPDYRPDNLAIRPLDAPSFAREINYMHGLYDWAINYAQLNLLDSHDMPRALWIMGEDKNALRLCALFQMTMPGAPCIYYGDEIGLSSPGDPECRGAFPWQQVEKWDKDLLDFYSNVIFLRQKYPVLRTGAFEALYANNDVYAFSRRLTDQQAIVVFNAGTTTAMVNIPANGNDGVRFKSIWPEDVDRTYHIGQNGVDIIVPPREAMVLIDG